MGKDTEGGLLEAVGLEVETLHDESASNHDKIKEITQLLKSGYHYVF